MNGIIVVDKPAGETSRDTVNRVQRRFPRGIKIGHAGTLDPLATGVLVVCVGPATRLVGRVQDMGKTYGVRFRLGATSDTDDADGVVTPRNDVRPPTPEAIRAELACFGGNIAQTPPAYSAVKLAGRRAHELARSGVPVAITPRPVSVYGIRLVEYEYPFLDLEIDCGKGTYIRSIGRDLGANLGCGGLVETLRRTRIGPFTADGASDELLPPAAAVAGLPRLDADDETVRRIRFGQSVPVEFPPAADAAVFDPAGQLVAVGGVAGGAFRSQIVFPASPGL